MIEIRVEITWKEFCEGYDHASLNRVQKAFLDAQRRTRGMEPDVEYAKLAENGYSVESWKRDDDEFDEQWECCPGSAMRGCNCPS